MLQFRSAAPCMQRITHDIHGRHTRICRLSVNIYSLHVPCFNPPKLHRAPGSRSDASVLLWAALSAHK